MSRLLSHHCGQFLTLLPVAAELLVNDQPVGLTHNCQTCGQCYVEHQCAGTWGATLLPVVRKPPPSWLPILQATVTATCPTCGLVINLADFVASDQAASEQEKAAAETFKTGALAVGAVMLGIAALAWANGDSASQS